MNNNTSSSNTPSSNDMPAPPASLLQQLFRRLTEWRGILPPSLHWPEEDSTCFPIANTSPSRTDARIFDQALDPRLSKAPEQSGEPLFTADLDSEPTKYRFAYDIQVALLRTRYYHAKYIIHRPYIYKVLHFPDQMSEDDVNGAAECLQVCNTYIYLTKQN